MPFDFDKDNGIFVIIKGSCSVINKADGYQACSLKGGEMFGESDILKIVGYDFFGDIIADSDEVECMYISTAHVKMIPQFELNHLKNFGK